MSSAIKTPAELQPPKRKGSQSANLRGSGEHYASQVTADLTCRCPHLDAYFPKYLDSGSLGLFQEGKAHQRNAKRLKRLTISDLHFSSILPPRSPSNNPPKSQRAYAFGNEEKKTDLIIGGGADSYTPIFPETFVDLVMKERTFEMQLCKDTPDEKGISKPKETQKVDSKAVAGSTLKNKTPQSVASSGSVVGNTTKTVSINATHDDESQFQSELDVERRITQLRKDLFSKPVKIYSSYTSPSSKKNGLAGDKSEVSMSPVISSMNKTRNHSARKNDLMSVEDWHTIQRQRDIDIDAANSRVEIWLETIRQNRISYWDQRNGTGSCAPVCKPCSKKAKRGKGRTELPSGDALMQCLDCSQLFCGSDALGKEGVGRRHMQQHFLLSNHNFAITCGDKGEIFCMKCGDFVYCDIFNTEKERVAINSYLPWFGWSRRRRLGREFCFGEEGDDFYLIPNVIGEGKTKSTGDSSTSASSSVSRSIVWRGFQSVYPTEVADEMILAARRVLHRLRMFRGDLMPSTYLSWDKSACEFATRQHERGQACWTIVAPVGIYNAGNICYISSVIQCIFNLRPIQRYFLGDVKHDFEACKTLRTAAMHRKHPSELCLACEVDKLMLNYFGNAIGLDVCTIAGGSRGMRSKSHPSSHSLTESTKKNNNDIGGGEPCSPVLEKGMPLVVSDFLATAWQLKDMAALAGNEQHDSHEFMQVFLDILDKDCKRFQRFISLAREPTIRSEQSRQPMKPPYKHKTLVDSVTSLFSGNLRSVLMCDTCGFKRKHMEPFINVSLSLPLNKGAANTTRKYNERKDVIGTRRRGQKIDVRTCIDHFSDPEPLADVVYCDWCKAKTKTRKQHTFAKLPTILCLHLKRFDAITNKKIDEPVSFPSVLDMGPYLPHWREVEQTDVMLRNSERTGEESANSPSILYDLCSTINHSGTLFQGHYISNVKVDNSWYSCSDSDVHRYSECNAEKEVLDNGEVYMLFYMRR